MIRASWIQQFFGERDKNRGVHSDTGNQAAA
jgi:hypothetical protein